MKKLTIAFLFVAATVSAQITLGPERLVCNPRFQDAPATLAAAAATGTETRVVMRAGSSSSLYLQRLGVQGEPLTPRGVLIFSGTSRDLIGIASTGASSVGLGRTEDGKMWSAFIDVDGNVAAPQFIGASGTSVPQIATNGSDYLVAWRSGSRCFAVRLDSHGLSLGEPLQLSTPFLLNGGFGLALASDGRDYFAAIGRTFVSVDAGTHFDLPFPLRTLVYTASGFIGFSADNGTTAVAIDPSGHVGTPAVVTKVSFSSAAGNGADAMALGWDGTAVRVRRNGDAIEITETTKLAGLASYPVAVAMHTGSYAAISTYPAATVTLLNGAPVARGLLSWIATEDTPAIASDGDLKVVAWREGQSARAARIRGGVTLDPDGLAIGTADGGPVVAINNGLALIAWAQNSEYAEYAGGGGGTVLGRLLKPDGTLTAPFLITFSGGRITVDSVTTTASGFAVLWRYTLIDDYSAGWLVTTVDANGKAGSTTKIGLILQNAAMVRRGDGYLTVLRSSSEYPQVVTDGAHFLEVFVTQSPDHVRQQVWAQPLDVYGGRVGTAQLLGTAGSDPRPRVTWNGSTFVVVSEASIALVAADGSVLSPLTPMLRADSTGTTIAGDTIVTRHSAIDTGFGDNYGVFVRTLTPTPPRHRATRR